MYNADDYRLFPSSWIEVLALEYARAHVMEVEGPVDFARLYTDAVNQIRKAVEDDLYARGDSPAK